ncbi:hypothetical protein [Effusibacillus dendaii]|uniref:Uncharacterized protein n=1 Tax=Effusibacillus dendaii TaxID=2743772 RepID=A0A7I8DI39_9BACL|nr:hypothetical protein [Effusibacillus dendaii]BCJ88310.1 hypothetical protein skT53_32950 [Effusibacillus dendaii]
MGSYNGDFLSGEISPDRKEFIIKTIRNTPTYSVWNEEQLHEMYEQLTKLKNSGEDSMVITSGMLPILLNRNEIEKLHKDLGEVIAQTHQL